MNTQKGITAVLVAVVLIALVSPATAQPTLINGGFEAPPVSGVNIIHQFQVPGWSTTASDGMIELWGTGGFSYEGRQHAEVNANQVSTLFQDVTGIPVSNIIDFQFAHRGRWGIDTLRLKITDLGSDGTFGTGDDTVLFTKVYSTSNTNWVLYTNAGESPIVALGNTVRFAYESVAAYGGNPTAGNFLDAANFDIVGNQPPVVVCKDITLELDDQGEATLSPSDVDGGSYDPDGDPITLSVDKTDFTCADMGTNTITLTVTDEKGALARCQATVTVVDTTAPVIACPADVTVEQATADGTVVPLTATATDICDADPTITSDELTIYPLGTTTVTFTATDDSGNSASCTTTVTVVDTTAPVISATVSPDTLWPPNHKMVDIVATVTVSDICDVAPSVVLTSITSDELDNTHGTPWDIDDGTTGDGNTNDDIQAEIGTEDYRFQLRAERCGTEDGRMYTITYTVTDASGNSADAIATVVVPHDMG